MTSTDPLKQRLHSAYAEIRDRIHDQVVGMDEVIDLLLIGTLSGGHCLLVGVPGLAKTLLIRTLADLLDLEFSRIQFTPDLMPSDIVGTEVIAEDLESREREFRFMSGPIFANVILADEINRTPPKTQAALIEAMEEHHVTIGGRRHEITAPFFVLATQNPIEQEGTYVLPAAQLDRFMFMIMVEYPSRDEERRIVRLTCAPRAHRRGVVIARDEILELLTLVQREEAPADVAAYATHLVRLTRPAEPDSLELVTNYVSWGVGPRGAQALVLAAKVRATLHGRAQASIDDVRALVPHVFRHRLIVNFRGEAEGITPESLLDEVIRAADERGAARRAVARGLA